MATPTAKDPGQTLNIQNSESTIGFFEGDIVDTKDLKTQFDATKAKKTAIVNAANNQIQYGGGTTGAIFDAADGAGNDFTRLCEAIPDKDGIRCPTGQAKITGSANLKKRGIDYVLHGVGPRWSNPPTQEQIDQLKSTYRNCLLLAQENNIDTVVFPTISAGEYAKFAKSVPLETLLKFCVDIAIDTTREFLIKNPKAKLNVRFIYKKPSISEKTGLPNDIDLGPFYHAKFKAIDKPLVENPSKEILSPQESKRDTSKVSLPSQDSTTPSPTASPLSVSKKSPAAIGDSLVIPGTSVAPPKAAPVPSEDLPKPIPGSLAEQLQKQKRLLKDQRTSGGPNGKRVEPIKLGEGIKQQAKQGSDKNPENQKPKDTKNAERAPQKNPGVSQTITLENFKKIKEKAPKGKDIAIQPVDSASPTVLGQAAHTIKLIQKTAGKDNKAEIVQGKKDAKTVYESEKNKKNDSLAALESEHKRLDEEYKKWFDPYKEIQRKHASGELLKTEFQDYSLFLGPIVVRSRLAANTYKPFSDLGAGLPDVKVNEELNALRKALKKEEIKTFNDFLNKLKETVYKDEPKEKFENKTLREINDDLIAFRDDPKNFDHSKELEAIKDKRPDQAPTKIAQLKARIKRQQIELEAKQKQFIKLKGLGADLENKEIKDIEKLYQTTLEVLKTRESELYGMDTKKLKEYARELTEFENGLDQAIKNVKEHGAAVDKFEPNPKVQPEVSREIAEINFIPNQKENASPTSEGTIQAVFSDKNPTKEDIATVFEQLKGQVGQAEIFGCDYKGSEETAAELFVQCLANNNLPKFDASSIGYLSENKEKLEKEIDRIIYKDDVSGELKYKIHTNFPNFRLKDTLDLALKKEGLKLR